MVRFEVCRRTQSANIGGAFPSCQNRRQRAEVMMQGLRCWTRCAIDCVACKQRNSSVRQTSATACSSTFTLCLQGEGYKEEER